MPGFKTFTNGSILPDTDLNGYLMTQSVIQCTSGTRPTPSHEGMTIYETDTNWYLSWDSANWIMIATTLTGVFTPTLTGSTTNPTLGTGGTIEGRWTLKNGKWCTYRGTIQWGTSGTAGSGQYLITLPFTTNPNITNGVSNTGTVLMKDASGGPALKSGICYAIASATTMAIYAEGSGVVTNAIPWTWASSSGDYISWTMTYEIT